MIAALLAAPANAAELRTDSPQRPPASVPLSAVLTLNGLPQNALNDRLAERTEEPRVPWYCYRIADGDLIVGTTGADKGPDKIVGTPKDDVIIALEGDDEIDGGGGNDLICAGTGNDTVDGSAGEDTIYGQAGKDTVDGGADDDKIYGQADGDTIDGGSGGDTIEGGGDRDVLRGGAGDDMIDGSTALGRDLIGLTYASCFLRNRTGPAGDADQIFGGPGNDFLFGGPGNDCISGDDDDDRVYGGHGQDRLAGGTGADLVFGERGSDTLYSGPRNFIFQRGSVPLFDKAVDRLFGGPEEDALYGTFEDFLVQ